MVLVKFWKDLDINMDKRVESDDHKLATWVNAMFEEQGISLIERRTHATNAAKRRSKRGPHATTTG